MSQLKLAILGAGRIAETMAETVRQMDDVCLYAVAAREEARAKAFAETYGAEHYYGSYEEMLQDDSVELVYIATPHSHHAQHAKLCIEYGRPVLCEKAFTWTAEEAAEVLQLAKEKQVFITEAMWVRYMPTPMHRSSRSPSVTTSAVRAWVSSAMADTCGRVRRIVQIWLMTADAPSRLNASAVTGITTSAADSSAATLATV